MLSYRIILLLKQKHKLMILIQLWQPELISLLSRWKMWIGIYFPVLLGSFNLLSSRHWRTPHSVKGPLQVGFWWGNILKQEHLHCEWLRWQKKTLLILLTPLFPLAMVDRLGHRYFLAVTVIWLMCLVSILKVNFQKCLWIFLLKEELHTHWCLILQMKKPLLR